MKKVLSLVISVIIMLSIAIPTFASPDDLKEFSPQTISVIQSVVNFSTNQWIGDEEWRTILAVSMVCDTFLEDISIRNSFKLADLPVGGYVVEISEYNQDAVAVFMWTKDKTLFITYNPKTVKCRYTVFPFMSRDELKDTIRGATYWELDKESVDKAVNYLYDVIPKY